MGMMLRLLVFMALFGRQTDGPYSDIEMMCVMSTEEAEFSHEWTTGEWKVEVNFDSEEILLDYASQVESDWPLTHGQFFYFADL